MADVTRGSDTTTSQVQADWTALTATADTGDSTILSYELQWDSGSSGATFTTLVGNPSDDTSTTFTVSSGIVAGTDYQFQVRAINIYGNGAFSSAFTITASDVPDQPDEVVTAVSGTDVTFTWTEPADNSDAVTGYILKLLQSDGTYLEDVSVCDGVALAGTKVCTVAMSVLRASPYLLTYGDTVQAIVAAQNSIGDSAFSEVNTSGATIETVPAQMAAPTIDYSASSLTQITVDWVALTAAEDIGGNTIDTYHLEYSSDAGSTWNTIQGDVGAESTATSGVQTGLTGGNSYVFRVTAHNDHGYGTTSATSTFITGTVPDAPGQATVALQDTTITIAWTAGSDNNDGITAYRVKIEDSSATGQEDTAECDGSDSDIISDLACTFTMATLLDAPYSLVVGDSIIVTVEAYNNYGWSAASIDSDGVLLVQTEPDTPSIPTRDSATTSSSLVVDWTAPATNGASITSYNLYWDAGTSGATFSSLVGEATNSLLLTHTQTSSVVEGSSF